MGAAYAAVRSKVWHAATADMVRAANSGGEVSPTNSSVRGEMRTAANVRSKMRPSTWMRHKMRSAAPHMRGKMRRTASHVRRTADVRSTARMSAAAGMAAAARPRRR